MRWKKLLRKDEYHKFVDRSDDIYDPNINSLIEVVKLLKESKSVLEQSINNSLISYDSISATNEKERISKARELVLLDIVEAYVLELDKDSQSNFIDNGGWIYIVIFIVGLFLGIVLS